ncbi:MAG TPA: hypothetical protein PLX49_11300 [Prolixibacteraceae bacterium]|nr:hypothetical protein [Prolixibacteraceae bacterium]
MGLSLLKMKEETDALSDYNVLVTILTDGMENASREFSGEAVKKLVDGLSMKNWTFTYIGANHDVVDFALKISITNTMSYQANEADMKQMFDKEKRARFNYSQKIRNKEDFRKDFYDDQDNSASV